MLIDYPYAATLALSDRLRILADECPTDSLDYRSLQGAADIIEELERLARPAPPAPPVAPPGHSSSS
jgi:hypothetical protein